ncbi:hypothetical protein CERSUDRAFT_116083 [Gelatoporia subvermispora B]|uniref:Fungal N-terminal domain-containing protein n=1 Tax=Ceriporiopsis subvermispora (strain B) TaxID=914234 RepID=M2RA13_CERS8|nr:hypothetical protein CERSUDRAFT_116083 [Gelatoporia subvermispora B]
MTSTAAVPTTAGESGSSTVTKTGASKSEELIAYLRSYVELTQSLDTFKPHILTIIEAADTLTIWIKGPRENTDNGKLASTRMSDYLATLKNVLEWAASTKQSPKQKTNVLQKWISETNDKLKAQSNSTKDLSGRKADKFCYDVAEDVGRLEYEGKLILQMFDDRSQRSTEAAVKDDNVSFTSAKR